MANRSRGPTNWGWLILNSMFMLVVAVLATAGAVGIALLALNTETLPTTPSFNWAREGLKAYGPIALDVVKFVIQSGGFFLFAWALLIAVIKIDKVAQIIRDYLEGRGEIFTLATSVTRLKDNSAELSRQATRLADLERPITETAEKIEEALRQIAELQLHSISQREDEVQGPAVETMQQPEVAPEAVRPLGTVTDSGWERLRELWKENCIRLDAIRGGLQNKSKRKKFMAMPRTNYPLDLPRFRGAR